MSSPIPNRNVSIPNFVPAEVATQARTQSPIPGLPQDIDSTLTSNAIFLVVSMTDAPGAADTIRDVLSDFSGLIKTVHFRDLDGSLYCTVGIGSRVWDDVMRTPKPRELAPFEEIAGASHTAVATPGDLLFHIRANRPDVCFEFERILLDKLGNSVKVEDEVSGFRYFDERDLLGFVDGTANPVGPHLPQATLVGEEDPAGKGGAYVVVQKYDHDLKNWGGQSVEKQEAIIGRTKVENIELPDATHGQKSHKTLNTINEAGEEFDILRDNMPFGSAAEGVYGTYFIGYARYYWVIQRMLERMFIGDPPGLHDQILDFSTPLTGTTFFAPSATALEQLGD
ncbi:Dyp-type peroxidase [Actinomycetaceae bacterium MB13-C1-2]|nr:Dyp-type peroxidase [Actinomycetaceae bacterium MB13-C1-2]